jgi:hypothetical protein
MGKQGTCHDTEYQTSDSSNDIGEDNAEQEKSPRPPQTLLLSQNLSGPPDGASKEGELHRNVVVVYKENLVFRLAGGVVVHDGTSMRPS